MWCIIQGCNINFWNRFSDSKRKASCTNWSKIFELQKSQFFWLLQGKIPAKNERALYHLLKRPCIWGQHFIHADLYDDVFVTGTFGGSPTGVGSGFPASTFVVVLVWFRANRALFLRSGGFDKLKTTAASERPPAAVAPTIPSRIFRLPRNFLYFWFFLLFIKNLLR